MKEITGSTKSSADEALFTHPAQHQHSGQEQITPALQNTVAISRHVTKLSEQNLNSRLMIALLSYKRLNLEFRAPGYPFNLPQSTEVSAL